MSTIQVLMNKKTNEHLSFSDEIVFQKSILGKVIKKDAVISNVKSFQTKFMEVLTNLKNLENTIYQDYVNSQAKFVIETFEREQNAVGARREILKTFDITQQMKEADFDLSNASYVLKLHFSLNDTLSLKNYLQYVDIIRIKVNDIILLHKDEIQDLSCKNWMFTIDYDFNKLDKVKERFTKSYNECNGQNFDQKEDQNKDNNTARIFDEFFILNLISFVLNFTMTIFIVQTIIEIFKYHSLKGEKMAKYRWLLRNKKNFSGNEALDQIFEGSEEQFDVHIFSFWNIVLVLGNLFNLISNLIIFINSISITFRVDQIEFLISLFLGFGCFFSWINILYILGQYENFSLVNKTLANSAPSIFWFSVGTAPIFLAYVFSGFCMYHDSKRYADIETSYMGLLALFAGDEIQNAFQDTSDYPLSLTFTYSYSIIFLVVIANVFVFLIESGYQMELFQIEKRHAERDMM